MIHVTVWGEMEDERRHPEIMEMYRGSVHYLDMLRAFTGSEGKRVYAQAWNCAWPLPAGGHASHGAHVCGGAKRPHGRERPGNAALKREGGVTG